MEVNGPASVSGAFPVRPASPASGPQQAAETRPATPRDEVQISSVARMFDELSRSGEVRAERLDRIRTEIDNGTYDSPEKLEAALLRLMQEHGLSAEES